jgi:hypothetical protein
MIAVLNHDPVSLDRIAASIFSLAHDHGRMPASIFGIMLQTDVRAARPRAE